MEKWSIPVDPLSIQVISQGQWMIWLIRAWNWIYKNSNTFNSSSGEP